MSYIEDKLTLEEKLLHLPILSLMVKWEKYNETKTSNEFKAELYESAEILLSQLSRISDEIKKVYGSNLKFNELDNELQTRIILLTKGQALCLTILSTLKKK